MCNNIEPKFYIWCLKYVHNQKCVNDTFLSSSQSLGDESLKGGNINKNKRKKNLGERGHVLLTFIMKFSHAFFFNAWN
jgi:hypothetical protein